MHQWLKDMEFSVLLPDILREVQGGKDIESAYLSTFQLVSQVIYGE